MKRLLTLETHQNYHHRGLAILISSLADLPIPLLNIVISALVMRVASVNYGAGSVMGSGIGLGSIGVHLCLLSGRFFVRTGG